MSIGKALVTGASRGIGRAIAAALVGEGWEVTGTCRSPRGLAARDRVKGVRYLPLDLGKEKTIQSLVQAVGDVDLLVNNAGESPIGPAEEIPMGKMREHFQVNLFGPAALMQAFLPGMRERRSGMILFIGSIRSEAPSPFSSLYSASKAAVRSFTECLRIELAGHWCEGCSDSSLVCPNNPAPGADHEEEVSLHRGSQEREEKAGRDDRCRALPTNGCAQRPAAHQAREPAPPDGRGEALPDLPPPSRSAGPRGPDVGQDDRNATGRTCVGVEDRVALLRPVSS